MSTSGMESFCCTVWCFWLLVCFNLCLWKHKVIGQQVSDQVAKSFLGFGRRFDDPWSEWGRQKPEPSVVLRSSSVCLVGWGVPCLVLGHPCETHATKGASDPRLRERNQGGQGGRGSWLMAHPLPHLSNGKFFTSTHSWDSSKALAPSVRTYFVPSVAACFSFPFFVWYISSPSASNPFLDQSLAVSLGPSFLSWAHKHQINPKFSRNRLAGQGENRQHVFLTLYLSFGARNYCTIQLLWDENLCQERGMMTWVIGKLFSKVWKTVDVRKQSGILANHFEKVVSLSKFEYSVGN